ncbi:hypothetical protein ACNKHW_06050 [Shigella flexneri]
MLGEQLDEMFNPGATFAVHFSGLNDAIPQQSVRRDESEERDRRDAFARKSLPRPNVDRDAPDIRVNVWLVKRNRQYRP